MNDVLGHKISKLEKILALRATEAIETINNERHLDNFLDLYGIATSSKLII